MNEKINILQIIDSLAIGGAERVSVNIANNISENKEFNSFLCVTRDDGPLKEFLESNVNQINLHKKSSLDIKSLIKLIKYIKNNNIQILHAHSSSFFIATIAKLFTNTKVVWHLHYGKMQKNNKIKLFIMKLFSCKIDYIFTVNNDLNSWAKKNFYVENKKIKYIKNYPDAKKENTDIKLPGVKNKRIVSLANLRYQKNHINLLNAFKLCLEQGLDWHLLLVGKDYKDAYSSNLKDFISKNKLEKNIHILGLRNDSFNILTESSIGVVSSKIEGLPVSLLEYGLAKLAVVSTNVGECANVLENGKYGLVVKSEDSSELADALKKLMVNNTKLSSFASKFHQHVLNNYSKNVVMKEVLNIYKTMLNDSYDKK